MDVAQQILDLDGMEAVTLRRIAKDLGVNQMTPYRYFETKDDLLEALAARVLDGFLKRSDRKLPWFEQLARQARRMHKLLLARPGVAELLLQRQLRGPHLDEAREHVLATLLSSGLDADQSIDSFRLIFNYVLGSVIAESGRRDTASSTHLDKAHYPVLSELGDRFVKRSSGPAFEFGLEQIIDSLKRLAASR